MTAYDEVDMEQFIDYMKAHPEIWDSNSEEYKDKRKKDAAWEQITKNMVRNFDEKDESEKTEIVKRFMTKWRNIRDAYARSEKKRTRSGQHISRVRQYIYAKQLSFLQTTANLTISEPSILNQDDSFLAGNLEGETSEEVQPSPSTSSSSPKLRKKKFENSILRYLNPPVNVKPPDEDQSFFDSILPSVRKLDEDQKLEFRTEVLIILKKVKRGIVSQPYPQSMHPYPVTHLAQYSQPTSYPPPDSLHHQTPPRLSASIGSDISQSPSSPLESKPVHNVDIFPNSPQ